MSLYPSEAVMSKKLSRIAWRDLVRARFEPEFPQLDLTHE